VESLEIQVEVPVAFVVDKGFRPLPDSRASVTATVAGRQMTFTIKGTDAVWDAVDVSSGGVTGAFGLSAGMAGDGRLQQDGRLLGVLSWPDTFTATLVPTSLESAEVTPAAAARDLAIDKWLRSLAGLTPMALQ
jgi:hypothetical protein